MSTPSYFSILTAEVRYDDRLTPLQKLLYSEITSLANKTGQCWASNKYFADLYNVSETWISLSIKKLIKFGYLYSKIEKNEGNKRYLSLIENREPIKEKLNSSLTKVKDPYLTKVKENNTSVNKKFNTDEKIDLVLETIKTQAGLSILPGTEAQQVKQAILIRKRFENALGEDCLPETLTEAIAVCCRRMKEDEFLKGRFADLKLFYSKIPLYSPLFKVKKEVYL
jgi:hypothetical protein